LSAPRHRLRKTLDLVYLAAGGLSALCIFLLFVTVILQMLFRALGWSLPGATDYAGYLMAAASFLAFAYTLNRGGHVRVNLLLGRLTGGRRRALELVCHAAASVLCVALAWHAVSMVYWSWMLGDVSQGQDASALWVVQTPVAVGAVILALCFLDNLLSMLFCGHDNIAHAADDLGS